MKIGHTTIEDHFCEIHASDDGLWRIYKTGIRTEDRREVSQGLTLDDARWRAGVRLRETAEEPVEEEAPA